MLILIFFSSLGGFAKPPTAFDFVLRYALRTALRLTLLGYGYSWFAQADVGKFDIFKKNFYD
jgi:hypothetical protein